MIPTILSTTFSINFLIKSVKDILIGTESGLFYRYSDYNSFNSDYDPRVRDWYVNAINNPGKIMWSDAYVDSYGKNVVTCSVTFNDEAGNVAGVVASDILIEDMLSDILDSEINDEYFDSSHDCVGSSFPADAGGHERSCLLSDS